MIFTEAVAQRFVADVAAPVLRRSDVDVAGIGSAVTSRTTLQISSELPAPQRQVVANHADLDALWHPVGLGDFPIGRLGATSEKEERENYAVHILSIGSICYVVKLILCGVPCKSSSSGFHSGQRSLQAAV